MRCQIISIIAVILAMEPVVVVAQTDSLPQVKGLEMSATQAIGVADADMIELLMPLMQGVGSNARDLLTEQTVKPYMMPPRKLGKYGNTTAYGLAAAMEYYVNFDQNFKDNLSPDYISLSAGNEKMEKAFEFLAVNGTVSAAIMPYDATAISSAVFATQKYKITHYLHIFREVTNPKQKVFEVRKALMRGNPVLVQMNVNQDFHQIKGEKTWNPGPSTLDVPVTLLVVSYDQDLEAFEVHGFWGKEWGINGYLWIGYNDFGKYANNGFVLVPQGM